MSDLSVGAQPQRRSLARFLMTRLRRIALVLAACTLTYPAPGMPSCATMREILRPCSAAIGGFARST